MTYATQQDLIDRFGAQEIAQLTDRANGTVIDTAVVGRALADADAEIDAYLATRYALPLTSTPPVISRLASDMARYALFDDRVTLAVRQRYEDALKLLKNISTGLVKLEAGAGAAALPVPINTAVMPIASRSQAKVFDATGLALY